MAIGPYETEVWPATPEAVEASPVRCPDPAVSAQIEAYLRQLIEEGDTVGGVIACRVEDCLQVWESRFMTSFRRGWRMLCSVLMPLRLLR
jgi:chorismate synthase